MKHGKEIARYTIMNDYDTVFRTNDDACYVYIHEVTPMSFKVPVERIDNVRRMLEILAGSFDIEPGDIVRFEFINGTEELAEWVVDAGTKVRNPLVQKVTLITKRRDRLDLQ